MAQPAKGLGRGLSALMGSDIAPTSPIKLTAGAGEVVAASVPTNTLAVDKLNAGKYQPRRHFDESALTELSESIERHGLMQPIVARMTISGSYEIIAGERRWRAAKMAGLKEVPVIIREVNDSQTLELSLIENIQRADLNPLEEAAGYQRLMEEFGYTQEKLSPIVGKSRSHIANLLRLLKLPEGIKKRIDAGDLSMGHARALLVAKDPEALAKKIIEQGLSVRQAEDLAKGIEPAAAGTEKPTGQGAGANRSSAPRGGAKSEDVVQLESMLADSLGLRVSINTRGAQAGEVVIAYEKLTELDEILRRLGGSI